jgi:hypothetical protein
VALIGADLVMTSTYFPKADQDDVNIEIEATSLYNLKKKSSNTNLLIAS